MTYKILLLDTNRTEDKNELNKLDAELLYEPKNLTSFVNDISKSVILLELMKGIEIFIYHGTLYNLIPALL